MNKAFQPLLELERKTNAGEISPLVKPPAAPFWPSRTHARRFAISKSQLELRKQKGLPGDARVANVAALLAPQPWLTCGELFSHLMADDSWKMVAMMVEDELDFGYTRVLESIEQQIGKLTPEEETLLTKFQTVGEVADFLEKVAAEGREKVPPSKPNLWLERAVWLFATLLGFGLLWGIVRLLAKLVLILAE